LTSIPLVYSFWFMLAAYVVHIIDESLLGGNFVEEVREDWWPQYSWRKLFWVNAAYLTLMAASIVLCDRIGSRLVFLPLAWAIERFFNAIWHGWGPSISKNIRLDSYQPAHPDGVVLDWFCRPASQPLSLALIWPGVVLQLLAAAFFSFYMPIVAKRISQR
jgi:hypothetical protein